MNKIDQIAWRSKTEKLNAGRDLIVGTIVLDIDGNRGIVVKINPGYDSVNHGCIYVRDEHVNRFANEYEHYAYNNWKINLRILDQ